MQQGLGEGVRKANTTREVPPWATFFVKSSLLFHYLIKMNYLCNLGEYERLQFQHFVEDCGVALLY